MEDPGTAPPILTAREAGLVACTGCGRLDHMGQPTCSLCGAGLASRDEQSLQKVWAWMIAGLIAYIPANLYPMLETETLGRVSDNTIVGGVIELIHHGSWGVAAIVFVASVVIPIGKFLAIVFLAYSIRHPARTSSLTRQHLFEAVEFVGRWSMIDVFVVAILSSLVHLGSVVNVNPGIAAVSFALSVAFTMLSAQSFDSRQIWDADRGVAA
jgi:paraquat-inducible protein A